MFLIENMEPLLKDKKKFKGAQTLLALCIVLSVILSIIFVLNTNKKKPFLETRDSLPSRMVTGTNPLKNTSELYHVVSSIQKPFPASIASNSITSSSFILKKDPVPSEMIDPRLTVAPATRRKSRENYGPSEPEEGSESRVMQEKSRENYGPSEPEEGSESRVMQEKSRENYGPSEPEEGSESRVMQKMSRENYGPSEPEEGSESRVMQETLEINYAAEPLLIVGNLSDEENHETVAVPIDGSDISGFGSMSGGK